MKKYKYSILILFFIVNISFAKTFIIKPLKRTLDIPQIQYGNWDCHFKETNPYYITGSHWLDHSYIINYTDLDHRYYDTYYMHDYGIDISVFIDQSGNYHSPNNQNYAPYDFPGGTNFYVQNYKYEIKRGDFIANNGEHKIYKACIRKKIN